MPADNEEKILFSESVRPPFWLLAFIFFLLASVALSIWAAFDNRTGLICLILAVVALLVIAPALRMQIHLTEKELRVGRAHIDRAYLGDVKVLTIEEMRLTRGRDADPAAYLAIRFWQPRGVKIEVRDARDPTPYWLVSSKKAKGLVEALSKKS